MKLRIKRDKYAGYEVQAKVWYWPFWFQLNGINTHSSVEEAETWANNFVATKDILKEWEIKK